MRIILTGGGSGGHVFPLIAVARHLRSIAEREGVSLTLYYLGPHRFGREFFGLEKIKVMPLLAGKWRRYASWENVADVPKVLVGVLQALWKMFWVMPDLIFSKGGYGSIAAILASRIYRVPVFLHESDTVPGLVNRYGAKFAKHVFVSFAKTLRDFPSEKAQLVGNPVRRELLGGTPESGRAFFRIVSQKPALLVLGGSQGAERINDIIMNTLPHLLERYEVIHQCGEGHVDALREMVQKEYRPEALGSYHLHALLREEEYRQALAAADLVVARAGSGSIFEIAAVAKPAILIPLSSAAANHQFENAYAYQEAGACVVLDEQNLTPNLFLETVAKLIEDSGRRRAMQEAARRFAKPDAAERIAQEIFTYALRG